MFSEIAEIKSIREQKSRLSEREKELTKPVLTDLSMIPTLYKWFAEIISNRNCSGRREGVTQRKKFIFIVLALYSPSALAGGKMAFGLRECLARVLEVKAVSAISDNVANVEFIYQHYKDFRKDVDWIYTEMVERLNIAKGES